MNGSAHIFIYSQNLHSTYTVMIQIATVTHLGHGRQGEHRVHHVLRVVVARLAEQWQTHGERVQSYYQRPRPCCVCVTLAHHEDDAPLLNQVLEDAVKDEHLLAPLPEQDQAHIP